MSFNGYLAFCPLCLVTKILILFRAANAQLKKHISQIPLQLVYAIILAPIINFKILRRISGKEICTSLLALPSMICLELWGLSVSTKAKCSRMVKQRYRMMTAWSWASCYMRKVHPYHLGFLLHSAKHNPNQY